MNDRPNVRAEADGMLRIALHRMAAKYPFNANLLSAGQFVADETLSTMGVTVCHGRLTFLYAPAFVVTCSFAELTGVLHHEINHVLFGHIFDDPAKFPDDQARIISQEVTVNEWLREPLPGRPITLSDYPQLPPNEDTPTRYRRLVNAARKRGQKAPKGGPNAPKNGPSRTKNGSGRTKKRVPVQPLDDHTVWEHARNNKGLSKMVVSVAVRAARQQMNSDQWNALPEGIRRQIGQLATGNSAGADVDDLADVGGNHTIDWRRTLRRFVGRVLERQPVFNRPPRRFPDLVGIIPAHGQRCGKPRVMAVIDTSASMDTATLSNICPELDRLGRLSEVTVVECDAKIQAVYPYRGRIQKVHGRGGTDFRPVFAANFLRRYRPDVIIFFTDGDGSTPSRPPNVPVIWCLTRGGEKPASWGQVVRIDTSARAAGTKARRRLARSLRDPRGLRG